MSPLAQVKVAEEAIKKILQDLQLHTGMTVYGVDVKTTTEVSYSGSRNPVVHEVQIDLRVR